MEKYKVNCDVKKSLGYYDLDYCEKNIKLFIGVLINLEQHYIILN